MKSPLNKQLEITFVGVKQDYSAHIASGGLRAQYPGIDLVTIESINQSCYAIESGYMIPATDSFGGKYIQLNGTTGAWFYVHLSNFNGAARYVSEGELIGSCGESGYSFGAHLHLGLMINGRYVDPEPYIKQFFSSPIFSSPIIINNPNMNTVIVKSGWGISNVAKEAGMNDWYTENAWQQIAQFNSYSRWEDLQAEFESGSIVGKILIIKANNNTSIPQIDDTKQVKDLTDKITKLEAEKIKIEADAKTKENELMALNLQKETARQVEVEKLLFGLNSEKKSLNEQLNKVALELKTIEESSVYLPNTDIISEVIVTAITQEVKVSGIIGKYHAFIDKYFKSDYARSLFKYDWFLIIAIVIGAFLSLSESYTGNNQFIIGLVSLLTGIAGQILKYLATNYDRNRDGKLDQKDSILLQINKLPE